jgi:ribosomal protein L37AE/L43A
MRRSRTASSPNSLVCPLCGSGELRPVGHNSARCAWCSGSVQGWTLELLCQIAALPDALGRHACECGHPDMRRLPDGVFHCPACGSEVLPLHTPRGTDTCCRNRSSSTAPRWSADLLTATPLRKEVWQ